MWVAATFAAVMAVTACAAPTSTAAPTPRGEEGLDQDQLRLLGLAFYGQLVDFLKVGMVWYGMVLFQYLKSECK